MSRKIYTKLERISKSSKNNVDLKTIDIFIKVSKVKTTTSKDSSGKTLEYKITLKSEVNISDLNTKDKILNQTFVSSQNYKVKDEYSETLNQENKSTDDLINKTYQEILLRLSQNI